eukprot:141896_1
MALSSKDGLWDRNFQSYEQSELDQDTKLEDEIKIKWVHMSCLKRKEVSKLIVGNDKSCHIFNALFKDKFYKLATISYANYKVNVTNSQHGIAQNVIIYSNKNPLNSSTFNQLGSAAIIMAQTGQINDDEAKKQEIIFIYAPNVPANYYYCISEFILFHFRPLKVICLDLISRGNFIQDYDEMVMPQIRKIVTSNIYNKCKGINDINEKKEEIDVDLENKMQFVDDIKYLETGNLISSLSSAVLQQCEYNGSNGYLIVSISDLDYLPETLISFGNVLIDFCPSFAELFGTKNIKKLRSVVLDRCAKYANSKGHLLTGRDMFC